MSKLSAHQSLKHQAPNNFLQVPYNGFSNAEEILSESSYEYLSSEKAMQVIK